MSGCDGGEHYYIRDEVTYEVAAKHVCLFNDFVAVFTGVFKPVPE